MQLETMRFKVQVRCGESACNVLSSSSSPNTSSSPSTSYSSPSTSFTSSSYCFSSLNLLSSLSSSSLSFTYDELLSISTCGTISRPR